MIFRLLPLKNLPLWKVLVFLFTPFVFLSPPCFSSSVITNLLDPDFVRPKNTGYLLIRVDSEVDTAKLVVKSRRKTTELDLGYEDNGFILLPLKAGSYTAEELLVPYFDYPYRVNLSDDHRWQFSIEVGAINYLGALSVRKLRTADSVNFDLRNQSAMDYDMFCGEYPLVCKKFTFKFAANYRDDFLELFQTDIKGAL